MARNGSKMKRKGAAEGRKMAYDDELVKIELDAAQVLAEFSQRARVLSPPASPPAASALAESDDSGLKWQGKRKRSRMNQMALQMVVSNSAVDFPLVKDDPSESDKEGSLPLVSYNRFDTSDDSLELAESPSSPLPQHNSCSAYVKAEPLVQHSAFSLEFDSKPPRWGGKRKNPKLEDVKLNQSRRANSLPSGGKVRSSKTVLTEEEKEMRRLRRIEANRESARQTIHRKKKLCEELSIKKNEYSLLIEETRKEIEAVLEKKQRMSETCSSLLKQLELASSLPLLTSSASEDSAAAPAEQTVSSKSSSAETKMTVVPEVQINRQDDNIDYSVEFAIPQVVMQCQESPTTAAAAAAPPPINNLPKSRPPLQQQNQQQHAAVTHLLFSGAAAAGAAAPRGYLQPIYSFYPGRTIAAENRRRRKELKQTRLYSRQVSLNS